MKPVCKLRSTGAKAQKRIEPVPARAEGRLWNAFVARYHYLGHHPQPGARMRYFVHAATGEPLAVLR